MLRQVTDNFSGWWNKKKRPGLHTYPGISGIMSCHTRKNIKKSSCAAEIREVLKPVWYLILSFVTRNGGKQSPYRMCGSTKIKQHKNIFNNAPLLVFNRTNEWRRGDDDEQQTDRSRAGDDDGRS